jgi:hypothetical protein
MNGWVHAKEDWNVSHFIGEDVNSKWDKEKAHQNGWLLVR